MWHYVLPGAGSDVARDGMDSAVARFIDSALRGAGVDRMEVREPYFFSAGQSESGPFDGDSVDLERTLRMLLASVADDKSLPHARLEGPQGQYAIAGLDAEIYLGLARRQEAAERQAGERGCEVVIDELPSPYRDLSSVALDPALDETAWNSIATRVDSTPLFVLERRAFGRYGERGHLLLNRDDVTRLSKVVHPRAGLATFPAELVVSVDTARTPLTDPVGHLERAERRLVYGGNRQPLTVASFYNLRELDLLLADLPAGSQPRVLVAPPFDAWKTPTVDTYVGSDSDGVIRSRLGYHSSDPD